MHYPEFVDPQKLKIESDEILEKKVSALLQAMTPEEKLNLCHGHSNPPGMQVGNAGYNPGIPRLGVPEIRMYDGPAGVTSVYETTGLPVQELLASTWDPDLAYLYGKVEGSENVAVSGNTQLGSQFDVVRIPQFRRNRDMPGEDPFLTSALAVPETRGIQDGGAVATIKHFGPASMEGSGDMQIDEQTLHEMVFPPFEAAAKEGRAGAFMCCYNRLNGHYMAANEYAQKTVLRDMWGFKGYMMSDWGANHSLSTGKGLDMEMPSGTYNSNERILKGIERGRLTWDDVEAAARHVLYGFGMAGYLSMVELDENGAVKVEEGRTTPIRMPDRYTEAVKAGMLQEHAEICQEIIRKGAILMKNDGKALPLKKEDWSGQNSVAMIGLGAANLLAGSNQERSYGRLSRMQSPADALRALAGPDAAITTEVGIEFFGDCIPAECLWQDADCTKPGLVRTYGVADTGELPPMVARMLELQEKQKVPTATGGAGTEFFGVAAADEDEEEISFMPHWSNSLAAEMEGHETGTFCCIDPIINFTCGTSNGGINQTWKNGQDGCAFQKGCAFTWEGFLRVPKDGTYTLILQAIGGNSSFQIRTEGDFVTIGSTQLREGAQWPWENLVCTPEGMEVRGGTITLEAGKPYPIRLRINASIREKDLQVRLAWITPAMQVQSRAAALKAAGQAHKVLYFISEKYDYCPVGQDMGLMPAPGLLSLDVPASQMELLREIKAVMQPDAKLILIYNYGLIYALEEADALSDAILNIWNPGQEGGRVLAELLTGQVNPSGKLAVSIPARDCDTLVTDTPEHRIDRYLGRVVDGKSVIRFDEGIFTGYRWYDQTGIKPLYAFGHGLSYTTFVYSDLEVRGHAVSFTVTNTGDITGTEIAQVYLGAAQVPAHIQIAQKQLCGFTRIENLKPGESRRVTLEIPARSFCYWDSRTELQIRPDGTKDRWVQTNGPRNVWIGGSSADLLPAGTVSL